MAPHDAVALNIEGRSSETIGNAQHFRRRHKQEYRIRIDEAPDQPRASNPVDLGSRPRNPQSSILGVTRGKLRFGDHRMPSRSPAERAAVERFSFNTEMPQPCCDPFAELLSFLADYDGFATGKGRSPFGNAAKFASHRARDESRFGGKVFGGLHVDDRWPARYSDQTKQFIRGNRIYGCHKRVLQENWDAILWLTPHGEIAIPIRL